MTDDLTLDDLPQPIETGTVAPGTLSVDDDNPNTMPNDLFDVLCDRIRTRGWIGNAIIVDEDGLIADGEHRWKAAQEIGLSEVPIKRYDLTDAQRRVIRQELNKINGSHDDLLDAQEYNTLVNEGLDEPLRELTAARDEDVDGLLDEMAERDLAPDDVQDLLAGGGMDVKYTDKIETPEYEPTQDEPPALTALYDDERFQELLAVIDDADLPEDVAAFARLAAHRHIVFDYEHIAEYYAHASPEVQAVFEALTLVIVDVDQAIEQGFVDFAETELEGVTGDAA
jgi:hypothetical protein